MPLKTPFRVQSFSLLLLWLMVGRVAGESNPEPSFAVRAENEFVRAQKQFAAHPDDNAAACQLARASYDWAEFATNSAQS